MWQLLGGSSPPPPVPTGLEASVQSKKNYNILYAEGEIEKGEMC